MVEFGRTKRPQARAAQSVGGSLALVPSQFSRTERESSTARRGADGPNHGGEVPLVIGVACMAKPRAGPSNSARRVARMDI